MLALGVEALAAEPRLIFALAFAQRIAADQAVMAIAIGSDAVGGLHPDRHALSDELAKAPVGEGGG